MRVTDKMHFENAARDAARVRSAFERAAREASTGQRVAHPEDDPAAAALIARHRAQVDRLGALEKAMGAASDELASADAALEGVSTALARAQELAVQLSNATYSASQRAAAAAEVDGLYKTVIAQLNVKAGHRYLFGGFQDDAPPFGATGTYAGDTGVRKVEAAPGVLVDASVRADVAVKGVGGGVDVLAALDALKQALAANDVVGVQGALDPLATGIGQVALARATAGSGLLVLDGAREAARTATVDGLSRLSHLADADAIDAAARLAHAERALDASLTASARSFRLSLLDEL